MDDIYKINIHTQSSRFVDHPPYIDRDTLKQQQ